MPTVMRYPRSLIDYFTKTYSTPTNESSISSAPTNLQRFKDQQNTARIGPMPKGSTAWAEFAETLSRNPAFQALSMLNPSNEGSKAAPIVYHGTGAAPFSRFNWRRYRGSGEGHAAFGEGTNLTDDYPNVARDIFYSQAHKKTGGGGIIKVHLPDDLVSDEFLQWDKHYTDQPEKVRAAFEKISRKGSLFDQMSKRLGSSREIFRLRGEQLYRSLPVKTVSETLSDLGIRGLRYPNNFYPQNPIIPYNVPKNYNYTVWDDEIPKILDYFDTAAIKSTSGIPEHGLFSPGIFR